MTCDAGKTRSQTLRRSRWGGRGDWIWCERLRRRKLVSRDTRATEKRPDTRTFGWRVSRRTAFVPCRTRRASRRAPTRRAPASGRLASSDMLKSNANSKKIQQSVSFLSCLKASIWAPARQIRGHVVSEVHHVYPRRRRPRDGRVRKRPRGVGRGCVFPSRRTCRPTPESRPFPTSHPAKVQNVWYALLVACVDRTDRSAVPALDSRVTLPPDPSFFTGGDDATQMTPAPMGPPSSVPRRSPRRSPRGITRAPSSAPDSAHGGSQGQHTQPMATPMDSPLDLFSPPERQTPVPARRTPGSFRGTRGAWHPTKEKRVLCEHHPHHFKPCRF